MELRDLQAFVAVAYMSKYQVFTERKHGVSPV